MDPTAQELEARLESTTDPKARIDILYELSWVIHLGDPQRGRSLAEQALEQASSGEFEEDPYLIGIAGSLRTLSVLNYDSGKYDLALSQSMRALEILEGIPNPGDETIRLKVHTYANISWTYRCLADYAIAAEYGMKGLTLARELSDRRREVGFLNILSVIYAEANDPQAALEIGLKVVQAQREIGYAAGECIALNNLSLAYLDLGDGQKALETCQECLELARANNLEVVEITVLSTLGEIYIGIKDLVNAELVLLDSLARARQHDLGADEFQCLYHLGRLSNELGRKKEAIDYLQNGLAVSRASNDRRGEYQCHQLLAEIFETQKDFETALKHHQLFHSIKETVFNEDSAKRLMGLQVSHQVESARKDADIQYLKNIELKREIEERKFAQEALAKLAGLDSLTGVLNRREFFNLGENEVARAVQSGQPLAAILLDLDRFKNINDTFGHAVGDQVLIAATRTIRDSLRQGEMIGRYGGDEFVILLPGSTLEHGSQIAERLLEKLANQLVPTKKGAIPITASMGIAELTQAVQKTLDELLELADQALYEAKRAGRHQFYIFDNIKSYKE